MFYCYLLYYKEMTALAAFAIFELADPIEEKETRAHRNL